ncbi:mitotic checkpoint regulator, MAD2B-interacting-domain-containing protein [Limtongia smithiae]|uniref:mitotic checkpoint regulator, MAD2B-interacting-domain-containing protein n=1 Tax=Limtongia smithiae TaxID=1125753 RepID=UPI0034CF38F9
MAPPKAPPRRFLRPISSPAISKGAAAGKKSEAITPALPTATVAVQTASAKRSLDTDRSALADTSSPAADVAAEQNGQDVAADTLPQLKKRKSKFAGISLGLVAEPQSITPAIASLPLPTSANIQPYKPLTIQDLPTLDNVLDVAANSTPEPPATDIPSTEGDASRTPPDIETLALQVGLDDKELQILAGRHSRRDRPIKIVDYSVDEQYRSNQIFIASGSGQTVQPVRSITSGKHQLRGLINSATQQRESLEESFAAGRRNKKESGAKYGF